MASRTVRLEEEARRALQSAFRRVPSRAKSVHVELPRAAPVDGPDEVFVLVLGPNGGLATRKSVPKKRIDLRELQLMLLGAETAVEEIALRSPAPSPPLTKAEANLLDDAGLGEGAGPGALEKSAIEFQLLVKKSLPLDQAARRLGVNASRLRQRLAARTLFGIKEERSWRIPRFQLDPKSKKLVRGIEKVLPHVRIDAHPLTVVRWFSTPHQDLVTEDEERPVTPIQWLAGGGNPATVADLATEI